MCNWRSMVLAAVSSLIFQACLAHAQEPPKAEPIFSNAGPDADEHGQQLGYPVGWPGIAISEGAIHSVDDTVQTYVHELTGKEIGKTPIQAFLHMVSGIAFTQTSQGADDRTSDDARLDRELFGKDKISTIDQSSALRSDARLTPSFLR
ncbi:hypothetical protein SAMN02927900_05886 [Rhizobium mongolense subsp. loessense]|uniref:Uncharacterized protein n=1 Tax=Rhizobium mongolense subsp. loessense TaxID=158890 RepID=A0A1G4TZN1_9HYPH|nr:hypothetical protein [Rhizobium mongolense]SCW86883.1 hypothetical protein SAMN02927900_05886 [Rhizobium mongolense subsp. loessense]